MKLARDLFLDDDSMAKQRLMTARRSWSSGKAGSRAW